MILARFFSGVNWFELTQLLAPIEMDYDAAQRHPQCAIAATALNAGRVQFWIYKGDVFTVQLEQPEFSPDVAPMVREFAESTSIEEVAQFSRSQSRVEDALPKTNRVRLEAIPSSDLGDADLTDSGGSAPSRPIRLGKDPRRAVIRDTERPFARADGASSRSEFWLYRGKVVRVIPLDEHSRPSDDESVVLRIEHLILKDERREERLRRQVDFWKHAEASDRQSREQIPGEVRREVWNRDQGKCVHCASRKDLEYDHIIPVSEGGATSVRNLQLLCMPCNREKSDEI